MSKNIEDILKEINKSNKELCILDTSLSKETNEIKKSLKSIDTKIKNLEKKIDSISDMLNTFIILIGEDEEDGGDDIDNKEWSPYENNDYDIDNYDEDLPDLEEEDNY